MSASGVIHWIISTVLLFSFNVPILPGNAAESAADVSQEQSLPVGFVDLAPAATDTTILFCPGTGTADADVSARGIRFTVDNNFRGVEVRLAAFPVGMFSIKAELRRSTGFTTAPIATTTVARMVDNVRGNHPYLPYSFNFGEITVSGSETFTLKLIVVSGPGVLAIESFGSSVPCSGSSLTADVTSSNPASVGDASGFKVVDRVYTTPYGTPDVDGVISKGEWDRYTGITFNGGFIAMQQDFDRLYLLIDVLGDTFDDRLPNEDYFFLSFDTDGDSAITPYRDINFAIDSLGNMRRQYYIGNALWGDFFGTNSSRAKNFRCEYEDGTYYLSSYIPLRWSCTKHRIWEVAIDLHDIEARAGSTLHMGFSVASTNPDIFESLPLDYAIDFTNLFVIQLQPFLISHDDATGVWLDARPIEITQAIQDRDNSLPLVQGKKTAVRTYGSAWYVQERQILFAYLYGTRNGIDLPGSPLKVLFNAPVEDQGLRDYLEDTANLFLPKSWTFGTVEFRVYMTTVNHSSADSSQDSVTKTFEERKIPNYFYIPINQGTVENDYLPAEERIWSYKNYLETVYPLEDVNWIYRPWDDIGRITNNSYLLTAVKIYSVQLLLAYNQTIAEGNPAPFTFPDQVFGISPNIIRGLSDPVWAGGSGLAAMGGETGWLDDSFIMAHEINHNLDKDQSGTWGRHVPDTCGAAGPDPDWPYTNYRIQEYGFDTSFIDPFWEGQTNVVGPYEPDFMSYCSTITPPYVWISPYRWQKLFSFFAPSTAIYQPEVTQNFEQVYYLMGRLYPDGSGQLDNSFIQVGVADQAIPDGAGEIEILDNTDTVLLTHTFPVEFDPQPYDLEVMRNFFFQLPVQVGAKKISLKFNGLLVDQLLISDHAPSVLLLSPSGSVNWGEQPQMVNWSASDADGDDLTFYLQYSPDNGVSWFQAGGPFTGTSATVYPANWAAGDQGILRIIASDGINTSMDTCEAVITVSDKPPRVFISKPAAEYWVLPGEKVYLFGSALDLEEPDLPEEYFVWVEGDEVLDVGYDFVGVLDPGVHHIRLYVTDSDDNTGWEDVPVTVAHRFYLPLVEK